MSIGIRSSNTSWSSIEFVCDLPLGLGLPAEAFFFNDTYISNSYLANNLAFFLDLLIYNLLAITTYFICDS